MEPIFQQPGSSKCLEILFFPDAELQKLKGGHISFAVIGPLSVLYSKDYNRFFLRLDDWFYPLMRRLPVVGLNKNDGSSSRVYCFPGHNGFWYNLRVNCYGSSQGLENFESILQEYTKFSWKGEAHHGRVEQSPDDKIRRSEKEFKQVSEQDIKQSCHHKEGEAETKNLTSRKEFMDLRDIKNRNFRKEAQSTIGKNFIDSEKKSSQEFINLRKSNLNMSLPKSLDELVKTPETQVPSLYLPQEELEDAILDYRDFSTQGKINLEDISEEVTKTNLANSTKGLEILFFEDAELHKGKGDQTSIAASGPLSVLYFKNYRRFFLCLDDWFYPLMRRLPVIGLDKTNGTSSRTYCLPGPSGFCYNLRVNCYGSSEALENFESILQDSTKFSWQGEAHKGRDESPGDHLTRKTIKEEGIKKGGLKKKPIESGERLSEDFQNLRRLNLNMTMPKTFFDLTQTAETQVPALYFPVQEVEDAILDYRDVCTKGNFNLINIYQQSKTKDSSSLKGLELLFFEEAQLQRGNSIAISGPLSVLYFKELNRFFLCLDDWVYPLMKRLPIVGMDKIDGSSSRVYGLPGLGGASYYLRINSYGSSQALENFESILEDCSKFSWKGEAHKGKEQSPDDKLTRKNIQEDQIKSDIKNRLNKEALQSDFLNLRRTNLNMILPRAFQDILKSKESKVPSLCFPRDELEEIILNYRDLASKGINLSTITEQKHGFFETIMQGVKDIKESLFGTAERGRETIPEDKTRSQNLGMTEIPPN